MPTRIFLAGTAGQRGNDPSSEKNVFERANELLVRHELVQARDTFKSGVQSYPRSARLWVGLGISLYGLSDYAGAVRSMLRAVDLRPEDPRPYFFLANAYSLASKIPDAEGSRVVERLRRVKDAHATNPQLLFYYALCVLKRERNRGTLNDLREVEVALKESERLDADFPNVHLELGILYQSEGKNEAAIQELKQAVKLDSSLAAAHYRLGQLYRRAGEKGLAEKEFQTFERLSPPSAEAADVQGRDIERFMDSMKSSRPSR